MTPDFWRGRRVFLTGHTGFKGSWLTIWLSKLGASVSGYALEPTHPSLFELAQIERLLDRHEINDVRDLAALTRSMRESKPDIVIHMAAQPLVRASYADPVGTYAANVMGTVNLLEAARNASSLRALLVVTTDKCYESVDTTRGYSESDALGGYDPYSSSKACAEIVAAAYRRSFFNSAQGGPSVATARAGNVIGGGDWAADRLIPDIMKALSKGEIPLIRSPHAVRPWQHVLEPLSGYLQLCEAMWKAPDYGAAWNFGPQPEDAKPVSWIADQVTQLWGNGARWTLDDNANHPREASYLYLDTAKASQQLGYQPRWCLDDTLASIVNWYKAYSAGDDANALVSGQIKAFEDAAPKGAR